FGERHLGSCRAFADQRRLAGLQRRVRFGRLELTRAAGRDALGVDFARFVGFQDHFADRRRMAAVRHFHFAFRHERDRRLLRLRQGLGAEAAACRQFSSPTFTVTGASPPPAVKSSSPPFTAPAASPPAAVAMPTAATASSAPTAMTSVTYLRMTLLFG